MMCNNRYLSFTSLLIYEPWTLQYQIKVISVSQNTYWLVDISVYDRLFSQLSKSMKSPHQADESLVHVVWQTWDTFWSETSISGVSNAGRARGPLRRLAWILIFVVGACFTYWTLNSVVADYRTYPVVTSVSFKHMTDGVSRKDILFAPCSL